MEQEMEQGVVLEGLGNTLHNQSFLRVNNTDYNIHVYISGEEVLFFSLLLESEPQESNTLYVYFYPHPTLKDTYTLVFRTRARGITIGFLYEVHDAIVELEESLINSTIQINRNES